MIGALISGAASLLGGERQNQASAKQAQKQMDFQEMMSNSAHQRQVTDLKKAGLNPILSAGGGGASSPGGAMAPMVDPMEKAMSSAKMSFERKQMDKAVEKMEADIGKIGAEEKVLAAQEQQSIASAKNLTAQTAKMQGEIQKAGILDKFFGSINYGIQKGDKAIFDIYENIKRGYEKDKKMIKGIGSYFKLPNGKRYYPNSGDNNDHQD